MWRLVTYSLLFGVSLAWNSNERVHPFSAFAPCNKENELKTTCSNDCKSILVCEETSTGYYEWITYKSCRDEELCNPNGKTCVPKSESQCSAINEKPCNHSGIYPHPQDCHQFIICNLEVAQVIVDSCPNGYMYSACTTSCDWKYSEEQCENTLIKCTKDDWASGKHFKVYSNNRLYYKCIIDGNDFYPQFSKCFNGTIFDGTECVNYEKPGCGLL